MVGVLRSTDDDVPLRPAPSDPDDLSDLLAGAANVGPHRHHGPRWWFPPSCRRCLRGGDAPHRPGSLTNVARHAGSCRGRPVDSPRRRPRARSDREWARHGVASCFDSVDGRRGHRHDRTRARRSAAASELGRPQREASQSTPRSPTTDPRPSVNSHDRRGPRIRVLVADDQALVRRGFCALIAAEDDLVIVGEAVNGSDAIDQAFATRPDVILMDVRMPELDGIVATERISSDERLANSGFWCSQRSTSISTCMTPSGPAPRGFF